MKNLVLKYYLFFFLSLGLNQVSNYASPKSFSLNLSNSISTISTEKLDFENLTYQEKIDQANGLPYKFGHSFDVDINFFDVATIDLLPNGDKIYRLKINSLDAYSINLIFNQFHLIENTTLFIYSNDQEDIIGAFSHQNNKSYKRFSTAPVKGDSIILEFFEPHMTNQESIINISNIINGYKDVFRGYEDSEECHNNVNCAEFQSWNDEVNSVVLT